ncbi:MAG TPA: hypothetical protein VMM92_14500, partial [Thermoanaerobaculia bacterium]|nr:hypothetical protein [Thermoanaerobaculia bacterium]
MKKKRAFLKLAPLRATAALLALGLCLAGSRPIRPPGVVVLDDFEREGGWEAAPSTGVHLALSPGEGFRGQGLCLEVDFAGKAGYAIARKKVDLDLPANYEIAYELKGDVPPNNLELKLIDPSGDNVWWRNQRNFEFPREWRAVRTKKRQIEFAWGPAGGGEARKVAAIEIVVTAGTGGKGTVCLDDLTLRELPPPGSDEAPPDLSASSSLPGRAPSGLLASPIGQRIGWHPESGHPEQEQRNGWHPEPGHPAPEVSQ